MEVLNLKKYRVAIFYNCVIVALVVLGEISSQDHTGQGLLAIPGFLMLVTPIHCGIVLSKSKQNFKVGLMNASWIVGFNILAFFVDIMLVLMIYNILRH